jgi:hypothetical protein
LVKYNFFSFKRRGEILLDWTHPVQDRDLADIKNAPSSSLKYEEFLDCLSKC